MTTLAVLQILVGMNASGVTAGAAQANASLVGLGKTARGSLGTMVPLGAAAAGLAVGIFAKRSVDAAIAFDQSFTRIAAISNATASDITAWKDEVLSLAGETAKAPVELADALFFLASAGLDANQVMPALEASAKAAASGLGETADVANIVASAMNAYSEAGLTAASVTDTLVAAVREGRAEPEEFAGALGRILPIASQAGVTFDQVAASMASLSNIGLDVNEGVTAMRGVLQALVAPGSMAAEAMAEIGLSAQDMLDAISEDGVIGALRMLDKAAKQNTNTQADYIGVLRKVVPNVRSLTGVLGLTGQEAEKVDAIFDRVMNSTGDMGEAFATTAESDAFRMKKALNDIAIEGQKLAADILPVLAQGLENITTNLGTLAKAGTYVAGQLGFGPSIEEMLQQTQTLVSAFDRGEISASEFAAAFDSLQNSTGGMLTISQSLAAEIDRQTAAEAELVAMTNTYVAAANPVITAQAGIADATRETADAHREAAAAAREQHNAEIALAGGFLGLIGQANELADAQRELTRMQENGRQGSEKYRETSMRVLEAGISLKQGIMDYAAELDEAGATSAEVIGRVKTLAREFGLQKGDVEDLIGEVRGLIGKYAEVPNRVHTEVDADTAQAESALSRLHTSLEHLQGQTWFADVWVRTHGGSTGFHLLEMLTKALETVTDKDWRVTVKVVENVRTELDSIVEALRTATEGLEDAELARAQRLQDTWLDQAKAYRLQGKELEAMLSKAERGMERLRAKVDEFASQIRSGFDLDLVGGLMGLEDLTATTGAEFLAGQLRDAEAFASTLKQLADAGLSGAGLANLASQGPAGLPLAQLLLGSPELMQQFNDTQAALAEMQASVAKNLIDEVFGPRLEAAGRELEKAQERVAKFAERLQKFLEDLRADAVKNEVDGIVDALRRLGGLLENLLDGGGGGGGNAGLGNDRTRTDAFTGPPLTGRAESPMNITIHAHDADEVGRKVHEYILRYQRHNYDTGIRSR